MTVLENWNRGADMANTELFEMSKDERMEKIKDMETLALLAELDDTIQFDMLKMSNENWLTYSDKKVYQAIMNELQRRL